MYKEGEVIIDYKPFVYEDGETYYFQIIARRSQVYHHIKVYKKTNVLKSFSEGHLWWKKTYTKEVIEYKILGEGLIDSNFNGSKIKEELKEIMDRIKYSLEGWDGFVGDVSDEERKRIMREGKINSIYKQSRKLSGE